MGTTRLHLAIAELNKTKKRIERLILVEQRTNDFLCRSSDNCWEYPNAEEKYEKYLDSISLSDDRMVKLERAKEGVANALKELSSL